MDTVTQRPSASKDHPDGSSAGSTAPPSSPNDYVNALYGDHLFSVMLSFIPTGTIFFIYAIISGILSVGNIDIGPTLYFMFVLFLLAAGNAIGYISLSSIMNFSIYWRSSLLSNAFLVGFMLARQHTTPTLISFGYYLMTLSFFHLSEYVFTALFNSKNVNNDSFLLNHSVEYGVAALASWAEFFIELYLFPTIKTFLITRVVGLFLVLFGESFRKLAMYTAGTNFNHYVQESRQEDHVLVDTGVYSLVRHPSYFGWFYWSIGTQVLLANPICTVLYSFVTWKFFNSRIIYEEYYLKKFFGKKYSDYQKRVPTGIPLIEGYVQKDESLD